MRKIIKPLIAVLSAVLVMDLAAEPSIAKPATMTKCKNHLHFGNGTGFDRGLALRSAYYDWRDKVSLHDGASWASLEKSSGTNFASGCTVAGESKKGKIWECVVSAKPCRREATIFKPTKPMP